MSTTINGQTYSFNTALLNIWGNVTSTIPQYFIKPNSTNQTININEIVPKFYPKFLEHRPDILFIGLNPSFSLKGYEGVIKDFSCCKQSPCLSSNLACTMKGTQTKNTSIKNILGVDFSFPLINPYNLSDFQDLDSLGDDNHSYHKTIKGFVENFIPEGKNIKYEQIDLFQMRVTDSNEIINLLGRTDWDNMTGNNLKSSIEFLKSQIDLTIEVIKEIEPKLIVVINAKASNILKNGNLKISLISNTKKHKLESSFSKTKEKTPLYYFKNYNKPVLLWSQLSGGTSSIPQKEILGHVISQHLKSIKKEM